MTISFVSVRWNRSNQLQFAIGISPPFNSSEKRSKTPQNGATSFLLTPSNADQPSALMELLNFGLATDENGSAVRVNCSFDAQNERSLLLITFDYFYSNLDYDPGACCLQLSPSHSSDNLASAEISLILTGGSSGSTQWWIIVVSVAVPVAVIFAILIMAIFTIFLLVQRQRQESILGRLNLFRPPTTP